MACQTADWVEVPKFVDHKEEKYDPRSLETSFKKKNKRKTKHKNEKKLMTNVSEVKFIDEELPSYKKSEVLSNLKTLKNRPKEDDGAKFRPASVRKNKNDQLISHQLIKQQPKAIQIGQTKKNHMKVKEQQLKTIQIGQKMKTPMKVKKPSDNDTPQEDKEAKPKPAFVGRNKNGQQEAVQIGKKNPMKVKKPEYDSDVMVDHVHANDNNAPETLVKTNGLTDITEILGMDCEMVGVGWGQAGNRSILARVTIVNHFGHKVYDTFVAPRGKVKDYRTTVSGVRPTDLQGAPLFNEVQSEVSKLLKGRILVGHSLHNDMEVLHLNHPKKMTRDTAKYKPFNDAFGGRTPSLKNLAKRFLGVAIQTGEHSSVQDSQAAVRLYMMFRKEWEAKLSTNQDSKKVAAKPKPEKTKLVANPMWRGMAYYCPRDINEE